MGRCTVMTAPPRGPRLRARTDPPRSCPASRTMVRPKPVPRLRVVRPGSQMSDPRIPIIPGPLSLTERDHWSFEICVSISMIRCRAAALSNAARLLLSRFAIIDSTEARCPRRNGVPGAKDLTTSTSRPSKKGPYVTSTSSTTSWRSIREVRRFSWSNRSNVALLRTLRLATARLMPSMGRSNWLVGTSINWSIPGDVTALGHK